MTLGACDRTILAIASLAISRIAPVKRGQSADYENWTLIRNGRGSVHRTIPMMRPSLRTAYAFQFGNHVSFTISNTSSPHDPCAVQPSCH